MSLVESSPAMSGSSGCLSHLLLVPVTAYSSSAAFADSLATASFDERLTRRLGDACASFSFLAFVSLLVLRLQICFLPLWTA